MSALYTNNASSTLASPASAADTSLTVKSGEGALFPAPTGSDYCYLTLADSSKRVEIIKVTARSGDVLTVERGQDGTTALNWAAGDTVELRLNRALLDAIKADAAASASPQAQIFLMMGA